MKFNHPIKKFKLSVIAILKIKNWKDYFLDFFGLKKGFVIYNLKNFKVKTRAKTIDKSIFTEVVLESLYLPKWLNLGEKPTIIDVGAHIGIFSVFISSQFKEAKIYAIEPSKRNFEVLKEQIVLNNFNIQPFHIALSNRNKRMKLFEGNHSARGSLMREEGDNFEWVKTLTLKNFFLQNKIKKCDLMKMDIEGGEYLVLYSTPKEIFDKISKIFLELHSIEGESKEKMMNFLKQMGFKLKYDADDFIYAVKND